MESQTQNKSVALIVGVTGMVGISLAEALNNPTTLGSPWKVYGVARRPKPTWFPSSSLHRYISLDVCNLDETYHHLSSISNEVTHVFWVALHAGETEEINVSVNSLMLNNVLKVLTLSPTSPLKHVALQTGTKHYMGPIEGVIPANQIVPAVDPPFHEESARLPGPNFYYALEDILISYTPKFTWSVHRSSIIIGASSRTIYNTLLTLAVYATICRYEGTPFRYPGSRFTWEHFCDMVDSGLLADQQIWASVLSDKAKNQAFNCSNGDVFMWKNLWKFLCDEVFDVKYEPLDDEIEFDFVGEMKKKGSVWDEIVEKNGLEKTKIEEITCPGALKAVLSFGFQHVCSMSKSREYGFFGYVDTYKSIRMWVDRLREMKIIPTI
ncbi:Delta-4,5-steroid 5-beta-reductase [Thalictrum thalictroides]|uniref:Delta-4,5-steroid 5-beta-reductase n=1 Tax=Thalictrum thalictroides TaxID=46969 RepID=A0A7J6XBG5_THATH|nr:Delta-4,5-steroid 5-beta-reductase [Thalictrum thalictroides]